MFGIPAIEWVGYVASIMIAISLIMSDIVKLRVINSIGCILFAIYGFTVKAYPVGIINSFIFFVNSYYLYKFYKDK
ncbi:MAG: YgjV family protein [Clostridium celatum]|uniref:YgjV family protein n=1 Tax=uncultured Clostridium sp. TaxID=59620 RepID=UPI0025CDEC0F|nr:YgjV family protein [uncultured Clostridium sp.]MDU4883363.1 YgjV family protein [Clostridium celatum]MDU5263268.1 YgjV family protein [Clostridium celatum]MDU7076426.1 YgjV family protein [Clostridium celatum]